MYCTNGVFLVGISHQCLATGHVAGLPNTAAFQFSFRIKFLQALRMCHQLLGKADARADELIVT